MPTDIDTDWEDVELGVGIVGVEKLGVEILGIAIAVGFWNETFGAEIPAAKAVSGELSQ